MIKFEVEPRIKIGEKVWVGIENIDSGVIIAEKALIVGYQINTMVTEFEENMELQYLVLLSASNHPEINVHEISLEDYVGRRDLFYGAIVDAEYIYLSEQEIPGTSLN